MRGISDIVTPEALGRLSNLSLIARWIVEGFISGLHASPYHGFSIEFAEYRPYTTGDDLRHFDWKMLAKSERKYVKKYHSETNMQGHVLLDCSASMAFGEPVTKMRYGAAIAASIAYLLILQQDAAGATLFAEKLVQHLPPKSTMRHFRQLAGMLDAAQPQPGTNASAALEYMAETVKRRGLFVIVTDLYDDTEKFMKALRHLRFKKHEVIVFHVLDHKEVAFPYTTVGEFKDSESGDTVHVAPMAYRAAYLDAIGEFTAEMRRQCSNMLVDYVMIDTETPFDTVLAKYLLKRQRLG